MKPQIENLGKVSVTVEQQYWAKDAQYDRLTIVEDIDTIASYISRKDVPSGIDINNREYWIPLGRVSDYLENFVEEEKGMLSYLEESVRNALSANQEFHDTAWEEVQSQVNQLNEIITIAIDTINSTNATFNSNEVDRVSAESKRVIAENERVTQENERNAAEALRQAAETNRELAEEERQRKYTNEYDAYETNRRNAETLRNAAESARQEQEAYRISNEESREDAESVRQGAENVRDSSETSRQQGEQARVTAENARVTAEINRQLQEGNYSDKPDANGSRWARFHQAQIERTTIAQQEENNRNTTFSSAESIRQNTFTTNEGKSSDSPNANGSRWARFNKTINDATTRVDAKITEIQNKANQDLGDLNELAETAANIEETLENKANVDGHYETMSVGKADHLTTDITKNHKQYITHYIGNKTYNFFVLPSENVDDGLAEIKSMQIYGGVYTQLIKPNYTLESNGVTVINVDNIITLEGTTLTADGIQLYPELFTHYRSANPHTILTYIESNCEYGFANNQNPIIDMQTKHYYASKRWDTEPIKIYPPANTYINAKIRLQVIDTALGVINKYSLLDLYRCLGDKVYDYNYNPGELIQVKNINIKSYGSNILINNSIVLGDINELGEIIESETNYMHKDFIPVVPKITYYCKGTNNSYNSPRTIYGYDKYKNFISILTTRSISTEYLNPTGITSLTDKIVDIPDNIHYLRIKYGNKSYYRFDSIYPLFTDNTSNQSEFELDLIELSNNNNTLDACKNLGLTIGHKLKMENNNVYLVTPNYLYSSSENIVPEIISTSIGNVLVYTINQVIQSCGNGFGSQIQVIDKNNYPIFISQLDSNTKNWVKYNIDITSETILSELQQYKVLGGRTSGTNATYKVYILTDYNTVEEAMNNITFYVYTWNVGSDKLLNCKELKYNVYKQGYQTIPPYLELSISYPTAIKSIISNLSKTYLSKTSVDALLSAISTATGKIIDAVYNETTQSYDFTVK